MTDSPIKVLLVDDHAVVRAGYKRYLELDTKRAKTLGSIEILC
jgi:DNA-binding NarL/FixJ family response regulator